MRQLTSVSLYLWLKLCSSQLKSARFRSVSFFFSFSPDNERLIDWISERRSCVDPDTVHPSSPCEADSLPKSIRDSVIPMLSCSMGSGLKAQGTGDEEGSLYSIL